MENKGRFGKKIIIFSILLSLFLGPGRSWSQTIEQDRRIEEEKRESLKPTLAAPQVPKAVKPIGEPPVPQPLKELYVIQLLPKRFVYRYDAAKSIVILMGVDDEYISLDSQVTYLKEKGFLPKRLEETFDPIPPLRKGVAAYIFYKALGIKGGIALHLFGPSERYALKELVYQGMMSPGHVNDIMSGEELVMLMNQAARYRADRELGKKK